MTVYLHSKARASEVPMTDAERKARVELAACYRVFDMLGWVEMIFNHITLRVPGPEPRFLINPFGLHYREVTASSLVLIDLEGNAGLLLQAAPLEFEAYFEEEQLFEDEAAVGRSASRLQVGKALARIGEN